MPWPTSQPESRIIRAISLTVLLLPVRVLPNRAVREPMKSAGQTYTGTSGGASAWRAWGRLSLSRMAPIGRRGPAAPEGVAHPPPLPAGRGGAGERGGGGEVSPTPP